MRMAALVIFTSICLVSCGKNDVTSLSANNKSVESNVEQEKILHLKNPENLEDAYRAAKLVIEFGRQIPPFDDFNDRKKFNKITELFEKNSNIINNVLWSELKELPDEKFRAITALESPIGRFIYFNIKADKSDESYMLLLEPATRKVSITKIFGNRIEPAGDLLTNAVSIALNMESRVAKESEGKSESDLIIKQTLSIIDGLIERNGVSRFSTKTAENKLNSTALRAVVNFSGGISKEELGRQYAYEYCGEMEYVEKCTVTLGPSVKFSILTVDDEEVCSTRDPIILSFDNAKRLSGVSCRVEKVVWGKIKEKLNEYWGESSYDIKRVELMVSEHWTWKNNGYRYSLVHFSGQNINGNTIDKYKFYVAKN